MMRKRRGTRPMRKVEHHSPPKRTTYSPRDNLLATVQKVWLRLNRAEKCQNVYALDWSNRASHYRRLC